MEILPVIRGGVLILQRGQRTNTRKAPIVLAVFEGNGNRPSHKGPGITTETDKMYTLNTTEVHGVIYEKPNGNGANQ